MASIGISDVVTASVYSEKTRMKKLMMMKMIIIGRAYARPLVTKVNVRSKMVQLQVQISTSVSNFTNIQRQVQRQVQIST